MTRFEDETRLVPDSITGFRQFVVRAAGTFQATRKMSVNGGSRKVSADGALSSLNGTPWKEGRLEAECLNRMVIFSRVVSGPGMREYKETTHPAPERECTCGIYALMFPATWQHSQMYTSVESAGLEIVQITVNGVIRASGKTTVGEIGFRAAHAEITALTFPGKLREGLSPVVSMIRALHPSIRLYEDHDEMYLDHSSSDFDALFDHPTRDRMRQARYEYMRGGGHHPPRADEYLGSVNFVSYI